MARWWICDILFRHVMSGGGLTYSWVTDLWAVRVNCSGPINLTQFTLHVSKSLTHVPCMLIWKDLDIRRARVLKNMYVWFSNFRKKGLHQSTALKKNKKKTAAFFFDQKTMPPYLNSFLVNCSGIGYSINFSCSLDVNVEHVMSLISFYCLCCSLINSHGVSCQSILLFQFGI